MEMSPRVSLRLLVVGLLVLGLTHAAGDRGAVGRPTRTVTRTVRVTMPSHPAAPDVSGTGTGPVDAASSFVHSLVEVPPPRPGDVVDKFCRAANAACRLTVVPFVRDAVAIRPAADPERPASFWAVVTGPPESPGVPRPLWLTIAASVPTALIWYGFYKFSVEEELFCDELRRDGRTTGCGGYGTLFPFVWAVLLGALLDVAGDPGVASAVVGAGTAWILAGQVNLYRRVNELAKEAAPGEEPPLYCWWALLPPPFDVVVGVRQVHFLAKYWAQRRGQTWRGDVVAEALFPFIDAPRFTLREFVRRPSMWFWFTADVPDLNWPWLQAVAAEDADGSREDCAASRGAT